MPMEMEAKCILPDISMKEVTKPNYLQVQKMQGQLKDLAQIAIKENDAEILMECILEYIDLVINICSSKDFRNQIKISQKCFDIITEVTSQQVQTTFVKKVTNRIFDIIIEDDVKNWCIKKELLKAFISCIQNVNKTVRQKTANALPDIYLFKLVDSISTYGDYDLQVTLIETIFRMYGRHIIALKLKDLIPESQELSESFVNINGDTFDEDVRTFLNALNENSGKVFSLICKSVHLGDFRCREPMDNISGLWVDFNLSEKAISWYCSRCSISDRNTEMEVLEESSDMAWNLLTVFASDVESVQIHRPIKSADILIYLKLKDPCISSFDDNQSIVNMADNLKFVVSYHSNKMACLVSKVLPHLFKNKFCHSSRKVSTSKKGVYKPLSISFSRKTKSESPKVRSDTSSFAIMFDPITDKSIIDDTNSTFGEDLNCGRKMSSLAPIEKCDVITIKDSSHASSELSIDFLPIVDQKRHDPNNRKNGDQKLSICSTAQICENNEYLHVKEKKRKCVDMNKNNGDIKISSFKSHLDHMSSQFSVEKEFNSREDISDLHIRTGKCSKFTIDINHNVQLRKSSKLKTKNVLNIYSNGEDTSIVNNVNPSKRSSITCRQVQTDISTNKCETANEIIQLAAKSDHSARDNNEINYVCSPNSTKFVKIGDHVNTQNMECNHNRIRGCKNKTESSEAFKTKQCINTVSKTQLSVKIGTEQNKTDSNVIQHEGTTIEHSKSSPLHNKSSQNQKYLPNKSKTITSVQSLYENEFLKEINYAGQCAASSNLNQIFDLIICNQIENFKPTGSISQDNMLSKIYEPENAEPTHHADKIAYQQNMPLENVASNKAFTTSPNFEEVNNAAKIIVKQSNTTHVCQCSMDSKIRNFDLNLNSTIITENDYQQKKFDLEVLPASEISSEDEIPLKLLAEKIKVKDKTSTHNSQKCNKIANQQNTPLKNLDSKKALTDSPNCEEVNNEAKIIVEQSNTTHVCQSSIESKITKLDLNLNSNIEENDYQQEQFDLEALPSSEISSEDEIPLKWLAEKFKHKDKMSSYDSQKCIYSKQVNSELETSNYEFQKNETLKKLQKKPCFDMSVQLQIEHTANHNSILENKHIALKDNENKSCSIIATNDLNAIVENIAEISNSMNVQSKLSNEIFNSGLNSQNQLDTCNNNDILYESNNSNKHVELESSYYELENQEMLGDPVNKTCTDINNLSVHLQIEYTTNNNLVLENEQNILQQNEKERCLLMETNNLSAVRKISLNNTFENSQNILDICDNNDLLNVPFISNENNVHRFVNENKQQTAVSDKPNTLYTAADTANIILKTTGNRDNAYYNDFNQTFQTKVTRKRRRLYNPDNFFIELEKENISGVNNGTSIKTNNVYNGPNYDATKLDVELNKLAIFNKVLDVTNVKAKRYLSISDNIKPSKKLKIVNPNVTLQYKKDNKSRLYSQLRPVFHTMFESFRQENGRSFKDKLDNSNKAKEKQHNGVHKKNQRNIHLTKDKSAVSNKYTAKPSTILNASGSKRCLTISNTAQSISDVYNEILDLPIERDENSTNRINIISNIQIRPGHVPSNGTIKKLYNNSVVEKINDKNYKKRIEDVYPVPICSKSKTPNTFENITKEEICHCVETGSTKDLHSRCVYNEIRVVLKHIYPIFNNLLNLQDENECQEYRDIKEICSTLQKYV